MKNLSSVYSFLDSFPKKILDVPTQDPDLLKIAILEYGMEVSIPFFFPYYFSKIIKGEEYSYFYYETNGLGISSGNGSLTNGNGNGGGCGEGAGGIYSSSLSKGYGMGSGGIEGINLGMPPEIEYEPPEIEYDY